MIYAKPPGNEGKYRAGVLKVRSCNRGVSNNSGITVSLSVLTLLIIVLTSAQAQPPMSRSAAERERARMRALEQFTKNFRDIQVSSQKLLKEHEDQILTPRTLSRHTRNINKNAKTLRSLMALGDLAEKVEIEKEIESPEEFNRRIQRLARLVWDFAHNPIHQNSKVFNTDLAAQAQTDLMTIIDLSKILSDASRDYRPYNTGDN